MTKHCHYLNPFSRWSTSMSTRLLLWEQVTSVLLASTPRRPCTLASACSATLCLTGKFSLSPSAASSTAPPSSSATTGRSRAPPALYEEVCVCKWVCESFVSVRVWPQSLQHWPLHHCLPIHDDDVINPHTHFKTSVDMDLKHNISFSRTALFSFKVGARVIHTAYSKRQHTTVMLSNTAHHS